MSEEFDYDVFISHSSADKPAVRELAERLKADGLCVWLDDWVIRPGDMIPLKIEEGLERSRALVLVMSANAFASEWVTLERHTALFRDPTNAQRRFIPLRLDDAPIKDTLRQFAYVDWRQRAEAEYTKLLAACRPMVITETINEEEGELLASTVFKGHNNAVEGIAMTPDGQWAVSCSEDQTVRVWSLDTKKCVAILKGHTDTVHGVAITADGRWIVSGSHDKTVRVWDLDSRKCIATLKGHTEGINNVVVTTDGKWIASCSIDETVRVWDLNSGTCIGKLGGHTGSVLGVAVTPGTLFPGPPHHEFSSCSKRRSCSSRTRVRRCYA